MVGVSLALGLPALSDQPGAQLDFGEVTAVTGGNLVALILSVILGVAIGALVRNQVVGVVTVLLVNFVLNPLLSGMNETLANLTPFGAAGVLTRMTHDTTLSVGGGALVLTGWTIVLLTAAVLVERRRDVA
jgi:ABC-type transport system involved in multi-copper enzyme maturation permease subunit